MPAEDSLNAPQLPRPAESSDGPQHPDGAPVVDGVSPALIEPRKPARPRLARVALVLLLASVACLCGYLAMTVPNGWFPGARVQAFGIQDLTLTRGNGQSGNGELIVSAPDATGLTLISVVSDLRSSDYAAIAWIGINLPERATARLLWRTDYAPQKLNAAPIIVEAGRPLPVIVAKDPAWIGRVTGLALAIQGPLPQPIHIRGVLAKPMGAFEILGDRAREWLTFEAWTGTSINTVTGGADIQDLPLPMLMAIAVAIAAAIALAVEHWRPGTFGVASPLVVGALFVIGWLVLDARWTANLIRQEDSTAATYAGKTLREKHLASEDAPLYAFIEKARQVLPSTPVRIFVAADADYFRGRAAYHLYPHSVYFDPRTNILAPASALHSGDWLLVYQRRGIAYDAGQQMLRWDGQTLGAELKYVAPGGALFRIR